MMQPTIRLSWTVAETLSRYPGSAAVFGRFRMACVGCVMAPFETLSEAAEVYGVDPQAFLGGLHQAALTSSGGNRPDPGESASA
jgi:hybrid cluster-associated redox disulfide protein